MANEKNVAALAALIQKVGIPYQRNVSDTGWYEDKDYLEFARELITAGGVLVPSTLTDDEACDLPASKFSAGWTEERSAEEIAREVRAELERIAKGEPP